MFGFDKPDISYVETVRIFISKALYESSTKLQYDKEIKEEDKEFLECIVEKDEE